jgi:hypothetical protein
MEDKKPGATLPSTHTPKGASSDEVNQHLDKLIVDREPVGRFELLASWAQRVFATLPSSLKKWLGTE